MRDLINNNQAVVAIVVVVVLAVALFVLLGGGSKGDGATDVYYYDLTANELVAVMPTGDSPMDLPNGNKGVQAFVFACSDCDDDSDRRAVYLQRMTERAAAMSDDQLAEMTFADQGGGVYEVTTPQLIREGGDWYDMQSPRGMQIMSLVSSICEEGRAMPCLP